MRRMHGRRKNIWEIMPYLWWGMFPEHLQRRRRAVSPAYYVAQGKTAYAIVSAMDGLRPSAALFRKLAEHFETCVQALNRGKTIFKIRFTNI